MGNLSPTPGAEKEGCAAKNKIITAAKNEKVRFTTDCNSRFRAATVISLSNQAFRMGAKLKEMRANGKV
jgi:hypothetical protein